MVKSYLNPVSPMRHPSHGRDRRFRVFLLVLSVWTSVDRANGPLASWAAMPLPMHRISEHPTLATMTALFCFTRH